MNLALDKLGQLVQGRTLEQAVLPLMTGLDDIPALAITPEEAVRKAAAILVGQFTAFSGLGEVPVAAPAAAEAGGNLLDLSIEDLDLPMRAYNALKRAGILKVRQLLTALDGGEMELLKLRNFGQKSLNEVREKLVERGFDVPESTIPADAIFDEDESDADDEEKA